MTQDLHDLEKDIEQSRAKLDLTIDRLQDRMSVSGVVDDMLGTARAGRYAPLFDNVLLTIKRNPVPVMLIAAGIGLLVHRLGRPQPLPRRSTHVVVDEDLVAEPLDTRVYSAGATTLQSPDEPYEPRRTMNSRI
ncbi:MULTISPECIES: DUF3618 domain-containing protein [Microvirga]|uniref:DUF3618 domain-containing protein n=1 Tax=Microvirga TaxID=186650 RepID=UPI001CFCFC9A|nr:DUF3618 domain-containing protein [Microvirga lenta]MCB5173944.1 DUF3618 domain-containing protein [Microvirga lenta]